jgi:hypothetical protein
MTDPARRSRTAPRVAATHQSQFESSFVTALEIATRTGYHRVSINQQVGRFLPAPFAIVNGGYVWRREDIEPFIRALVLRAEGERAVAAAQLAVEA